MYLTLDELAVALKLSKGTIRNQIKKGMPNIQMGRVYRFVLSDVIEWFKKEFEREEVKKSAEQDAIHRTSNKQKD